MKQILILTLILILFFIMAACGTQPEATTVPPTDTAVPTEAALPTEEPTPEPTPEPTAEPTVEPTAVPEAAQELPLEAEIGEADVAGVTIEQQGDNDVAVVVGSFRDGCTNIYESSQTVIGNAIQITLATTRPADMMCTQALVDYTHEIVIDSSGLAPGEYTVAVNSVAADQTIVIGDTSKTTITNVVWQWEAFQDSASGPEANDIEVANLESYLLVLWDDGTFSAQADCNVINGSYTLDGNSLSFQLGPQTLAACPPESLADQFTALLSNVVTYVTQEDTLYLNLMADGGNMIFADGGPAESASVKTETPGMEIVGIEWKWVEITDPAAGQANIDNPDAYRMVLLPDGRIAIQADCNNASGQYDLDDGNIEILIGATTLALCPENSLGDLFIRNLNAAAIWFTRDENLFFDLKFDSGTMKFEKGADTSQIPGSGEEDESDELSPDSIQMDLQGLADSYQWVVQSGYPSSPGPGGFGMPPHILLTFDGESADEALANNGRYMYIFPVETYESLVGQPVRAEVERLEELIATADGRAGIPDSPMPILPPPQSFMDRWVQFADLNFNQGQGVRYVSEAPNRQDIGPWINPGTAYYYQGLTEGGGFYLSLHWPVMTGALPDTPEEVPQEVVDVSTNPETYEDYLQETKDRLNALPSSAWDPDLARLDALITSLEFQP